MYDYGFRIYDPRIAKFLSVDPLFRSYPWYTPYQFAGNKPIMASDLDGLEEKVEIYAEDDQTCELNLLHYNENANDPLGYGNGDLLVIIRRPFITVHRFDGGGTVVENTVESDYFYDGQFVKTDSKSSTQAFPASQDPELWERLVFGDGGYDPNDPRIIAGEIAITEFALGNILRTGKVIAQIRGFKATSGLVLALNPKKVVTVLGNYGPDLKELLKRLEYPLQTGTMDDVSYHANKGTFNLLNVSDNIFFQAKNSGGFFTQINKKWLDYAVARGDDIVLASDLKYMYDGKGGLTGFGKEIQYLVKEYGYKVSKDGTKMIAPVTN